MNSFTQLEYNKIIQILSQSCHSPLGRKLAEELTPLTDSVRIRERLEMVRELQEVISKGFDCNFEQLNDITGLLRNYPHQTYNFSEFFLIFGNLSTAQSFEKNLPELAEYPLFHHLIRKIYFHPALVSRFTEIFTQEGQVKDSASGELSRIRQRQRRLRQQVVENLNLCLEDFERQNYLFDKIITQRDGRYVIPVKDSFAQQSGGIIHGRSGSRSSVYVEPREVVGLNNELDLLVSEEKEEVFRIYVEYSSRIRAQAETILADTVILQFLDFHFACARVANRLHAIVPRIIEEPQLRFVQARHPLLIETLGSPDQVVPFDLELGKEYRLLVISGPNTGGKTVTLKAVGLLTMMALSGLPIPAADGTEIGIFHHFFADIGDYQSLESSLSTFSSHIANIQEMIESGNERSLIVIDEIGAATDPEQGSALAQAIIEDLAEKQVTGVITTHYTALKVFAEQHPLCMNAAMQFDPELHSPTYQIILGLPGNSFAIEVASRLGFKPAIIAKARQLAGKQNIEFTDLLTRMSAEKNELARQNYQYKLNNALLKQKTLEYEKKLSSLDSETREIRRKSAREARDFLTNLQKELTEELNTIRKTDRRQRKTRAEETLKKVVKLAGKMEETAEELTTYTRKPLTQAEIGKVVWVKDFEDTGRIVAIKENLVKVEINDILYSTSLDNLFETDQVVIKDQITEKTRKVPAREVKFELKILGLTFEEALPLLEQLLDDASMHGLPLVRIVHGKGTGALRAKVRKYLSNSDKVSEYYTPAPEAGGDGVTIARIRD